MGENRNTEPNGSSWPEGEHYSLDLSNLSAAEALVNRPEIPYCELINLDRDSCTLPEHIATIDLCKYDEDNGESVPSLASSITFDPELVRRTRNWDRKTIRNLRERLEPICPIYSLPHDPSSLYVQLDATFLARIQTEATLDTCEIEACLIKRGDFENILGELLDLGQEHQLSPDTGNLIVQMSFLLGVSLDSIITSYNPKIGSNVIILKPNGSAVEAKTQRTESKVSPTTPTPGALALGVAAMSAMANKSKEKTEVNQGGNESIKNGLDSVGGNFVVKARLSEIADSFKDTESAKLYRISPTNFLLYGQPGTGKTSLVNAFASEIGAGQMNISAADISSMWVGGSAKNLKDLLNKAKRVKNPTVVFLDEIDAIIGRQASGSNQTEAKRLLQTALTELPAANPNVIFAAATNVDRDHLDPAFIRPGRFEAIQVPLPTREERQDLWATIISNSWQEFGVELSVSELETASSAFVPYIEVEKYDYAKLADLTDGWTGADVAAALEAARRSCLKIYKSSGRMAQITNELLYDKINSYGR